MTLSESSHKLFQIVKVKVYKAAIAYMNDVQFTTLKHEHFFGVSYEFYSMSCSSEDGKFGSNVSFLGKLQNLRPRRRLDGTVDI